MSIDFMTDVAVERADSSRVGAGAPARTVVTPVPRIRRVSVSHAGTAPRVRLARQILTADIAVTVLAGAAGIVFGLSDGDAPQLLIPLVIAVHLVWLHRVSRTRPLDIPLLRMGSAEMRGVFGTVRTVFGPLVVLEVFFPALLPHALIVICGPVALGGILLSRLWFRSRLTTKGDPGLSSPTLVVGGYASVTASARSLVQAEHAGARIVGACLPSADAAVVDALDVQGRRIPVVGTDRTILEAALGTGATVVVLTATDSIGPDDVRDLVWKLAESGIELVMTAGLTDVAGSRIVYQPLGGTPMMHVAGPQHSRSFGRGKRALDLVVAGVGLLFAAPVMAAIALAIKLDSRGPVLYRAERVGADGALFEMIKFRSMYTDADARREKLAAENMGSGPLFKVKNDPRVTKVGRVIRRYSLDELPQFFNVIRGEMAVVGPRPALAHEVEAYPPIMRRRLLVKPGVTGAWQVGGRSDLPWDESIRLDVGYVDNWSLGSDIGIIARTFRTVLTSDGAY